MIKNRHYFFILVILFLASCAKRGNITGGLKDTIAPVIKTSFPANYSTNFKEKTIKLTFDEYVKLKNVNKQLIVSPPFDKTPEITPSLASKVITIKIKDTLLPNTTYSMNFGQSIEDNNEGNPYKQFKYVFSTGSYIDSLQLSGKIKDALEKKTDNFVSIQLYDIDEKYNDSVIFKQKPRYVTNTLDSSKTFVLENLKAGKYLLIALKDKNNNYKFDSKSEKIGFQKQFITIPNDTVFELELFQEKQLFKSNKPSQVMNNKLFMGYLGNFKNSKITLSNGSTPIPIKVTKVPEKDSVNIWFKRAEMDSVLVNVTNDSYTKDFVLKLKKQKADTLSISLKQNGTIGLKDKMRLKNSIPIVKIDDSKIVLTNKDSVKVKFKTFYDDWNQEIEIDFEKEPLEKYKIKIFPGAFIDFFNQQNDTLSYSLSTKNLSDYGNLRLKLDNVKLFPIIIQLTNKEGKVIHSKVTDKSNQVNFDLIEPATFTLRIIYDKNANGEWDSGNFLEKRQSEKVIYFPKEIDIRANWDVEQVFDLSTK